MTPVEDHNLVITERPDGLTDAQRSMRRPPSGLERRPEFAQVRRILNRRQARYCTQNGKPEPCAIALVFAQLFVARRQRRNVPVVYPNVTADVAPVDDRDHEPSDLPIERFDDLVARTPLRRAAAAKREEVSYLPDDILCKVDRASMAVSLESRVPFLDWRVAEVVARIPLAMKVKEGRGKAILRKLLDRYVPRQLVDRPKVGFAVPVGEWIKGPLRDWAEDLLDARSLRQEGWFDADAVRARWSGHLTGRQESTAALWAVLMFEAWLREQKAARAVAA
jgi:asparagine synthetase B (glutamine-hydrolysing)